MTAELLTAAQVGRLLDVDISTVYRMAGDGRLPAVRVGRQWRFPADQITRSLQVGIPANGTATTPTAVPPTPTAALGPVVDLVAASLGVMMVVTDMQGQPVTPVANPCPWFVEHAQDPQVLAECVDEWRAMADELDLAPRFRQGHHGFLCARTFVRSGTELVGMVLAGGIAPEDGTGPGDGLYHLDRAGRRHVLGMLPRLAAVLSPLLSPPLRGTPSSNGLTAAASLHHQGALS